MNDLAIPITIGNAEEQLVVRIVRQDPPPIALSEANCAQHGLGSPSDWLPFLRRWKVAYRKNGGLHVALAADVEAAIRDARRPGPAPGTQPKKPLPMKNATPSELLERSGFRRAQ